MKLLQMIMTALAVASTPLTVIADDTSEPNVEVAAALKGMGDAANAHDVERHVGFYAHTPGVTLIVNGERYVGWETIRDKQKEWWDQGKTDVIYELTGPPDIRQLAPGIFVTTLMMKSHRTLSSGEAKDGRFAVSSVWKRLAQGWKVVYSHESSTR